MSGGTPHGGGIPINTDRPEYRTMLDWIQQGLPIGTDEDPVVVSLETYTASGFSKWEKNSTQLRAMATLSDGRQIDVTELTQFQPTHLTRRWWMH